MRAEAAVRRPPAGAASSLEERLRAWAGPRTLVLGAVLVVMVGSAVRPVLDPDFWWHLQNGSWIVAHGALPGHDLYTFTAVTHPVLDPEWLTEVLIWLAYRLGGAALVSLAFGLLTFAGMLCIFLASEAWRRPPLVAGAGLGLGVLAAGYAWGPRPQMITFAFASLQLLWTQRFLAGRSRALRWLPLLVALWANLHGGFVVSFALLGVALISQAVGWWQAKGGPAGALGRRRTLELAAIGAVSVLAVMATPQGYRLWIYALITQTSPAQQSLIDEWLSPDFHQLYARPLELFILALVAGFAVHRPNLYQVLLCLLTLALTLQSARHVVFLVAAATPVLVECWSVGWERWRQRPALPAEAARSNLRAVLNLAMLGAVVAVFGARDAGLLVDQDRITRGLYPVAAADWLQGHPELGHRIFNDYGYGGYLVARFAAGGQHRLFVYGEAEVMGDRLLREYALVQTLRPGWRQVLHDYGVDAVLVRRGVPLDQAMAEEPGWQLAYEDGESVLYVRPQVPG